MKTKLLAFAGIVLTMFCLISCNKKSDDQLTNLQPYRYDTQQAQTITETSFNTPTTLQDHTNGVDYIIKTNMDVTAPLIINAGVTLLFEKGAGLTIQRGGYIKAIGTDGNEIYFTSRDGKRGSWKGITVLSLTSDNVLEYCLVEHAGGDGSKGNIEIGSANTSAMLAITNSTITTSKTDGIYIYPGSVVNHFRDNTIQSNTEYGLSAYIADVADLKDENNFLNNGKEFVRLTTEGGIVDHPITLNPLKISYLIPDEVVVGNTFTIKPGTHITMQEHAGIVIDGVYGTAYLNAVGTPSSPIVIDGIYNGEQAGVWQAIRFNSSNSANNKIEHCIISGGGAEESRSINSMIAIQNERGPSSVIIRSNHIKNSSGYGIYIQESTTTYNTDIITANTFSGNMSGNTKFE